MKDIILVVVILLSVGLSVMVVRFNEKATKAGKNLEEERYSRMVAEESLQKNSAKLAVLESQLKAATGKMAKIQDIVDQEKGVNQDLKKQYEQLSATKAELEAKLQSTINEQNVANAAAVSPAASAAAPADNAQAPVNASSNDKQPATP